MTKEEFMALSPQAKAQFKKEFRALSPQEKAQLKAKGQTKPARKGARRKQGP